MQEDGRLINQVFLTTARQILIMLFCLLVLRVETGKSKIPGELRGESLVLWDWLVEIHVVFVSKVESIPIDLAQIIS